MSSIIEGYNYDIFISYRQKDNKGDKWVSEFVDALKTELESTFKEEISVYFDINQHDGLLETHDVDASLKDKLKCLVLIPIISQTYCDSKSFAWQHEFVKFNKLAMEDQFGRDIRLSSGNVASRILPVKINDLDPEDKVLLENELGGVIRCIEFIYKATGVNRPLRANEDHPQDNLNKTYYRDQINKVANAVKEIITSIKKHNQKDNSVSKEGIKSNPEKPKNLETIFFIRSGLIFTLIVLVGFFIPKLIKSFNPVEMSIAVLPFKNGSPNDSTAYFIDGVMEEILTNLQTIKVLRVISRTSVEQYRNTTKSIPEIAKDLVVKYIVEGSGQKYGNKFRLRVQLVRADKESHLWAKSYELENPEAKDYFSIQSQIAQSITLELGAVITPQEKQLIEKTPTTNLAAYEAYLQGISYYRKYTQNDSEVALQYFEQAKERDPEYALAYVGIYLIWWQRMQYSFASPAEAIPKAKAALKKALELDSTRSEVYLSLANIKTYMEWDWNGAESLIIKAIALNPNDADAHAGYSSLLTIVGRMKEAIEHAELACKINPVDPGAKAWYGLCLLFARRYDDAIRIFQEVIKKQPDNVIAIGNIPEALHQRGRYEEELNAWKFYFNSTFKDFVHVFDQGYAKAGYTGALNLEADTLLAQSKTNFINLWEIACIYACAGNKERTIDMLERAYEMHDPNAPFILYPIFDFIRNDLRFQELCRKMNLPYKI
jgi:TolB-like protein